MGRPKGSKNRTTIEREEMATENAPEITEDEPDLSFLADPDEPAPQAAQKAITGDEALEMLRAAAQTPEGRKILGLAAGEAGSAGVYRRNYKRDVNLQVTGGLEVEHAPDFRPKPPSYVTMYVGANGGETNYEEPYYLREKKAVPKRDANGKIVVMEDGTQVFEDQFVEIMVDPGAEKDAKGEPVLTEQYKLFLDRKLEGRSLTGKVRDDIMAGAFVANDPGVGV
jgi:hypothetical protein